MPFVLIIVLLFSTLLSQPALHAHVEYATITPNKRFIPESAPFKGLFSAYKQFDYQKAVQEAKRLKRKRSNEVVAGQAAFILAELYLIMAENGRPFKYTKAIKAFQDARMRHPESTRAISALWKIGEIYIRRKFYYEALASFKRILKNHPESRFVMPARLGKAETYLAWGKWEKAIQELNSIDPIRLSKQERTTFLLAYANAYYHLNDTVSSYRYYKLVPPEDKTLHRTPETLLQYGSVAFKAQDYERSREALSALYRRYARAPEAPLALARIGDTWRLERFSHQAKKIYDGVRSIKANQPGIENARLVASVGKLHIAGCFPRPLLTTVSECEGRNVLNRLDGRQALKEIKEETEHLLNLEKLSSLSEDLLFEAIAAIEQHGAYSRALEIEEMILKQNISFKLKMKVEKSIQATVLKAANQLVKRTERLKLVEVYYQHRALFAPKRLKGETGFQIGIALNQAGLYEESIELLIPIARNRKGKNAQDALFYLANAEFSVRDYDASEQNVQQYLERYPKNARIPLLQMLSAKISSERNQHKAVIKKALTWLKKYPEHRGRKKMQHLLSAALEQKGALKDAIASYLKIKSADPVFSLKIADLYYRLKAYKKAIPFYQKVLQTAVDGEKSEWSTFQLAKSYEALGQTKKGMSFFLQLTKNSEDSLIKKFSLEKTKPTVNP